MREKCAPKHYKIVLSYDGGAYCGWQTQPTGLSIQQVVEEKLAVYLRCRVPIVGAGRTDAGVHAIGQVAHFACEEKIDEKRFILGLNALLPRDIAVKEIDLVEASFHARYSACNKVYHYHIYLEKFRNPFSYPYHWSLPYRIDLDLLHQATQCFIGRHDFTSFANEQNAGAAKKNPIRTIHRLDAIREEGGVRLEFEGESFLYKMVRNITGTLIDVARKKRPIGDIPEIFGAKDRRKASSAAPACGLFLVRVDYPPKITEPHSPLS